MEPFRVRVAVRGYEVDPRGHLNQAVYVQYAEHARWELLAAAGISHDALAAAGIGPVVLETRIQYLAELLVGDEVDVTCEFVWGGGKTFRVRQDFLRPDGTRVAKLTAVGGILDLARRRLVEEPGNRLGALATEPARLGA
jgi:acyl-CoA thioester hydrolase